MNYEFRCSQSLSVNHRSVSTITGKLCALADTCIRLLTPLLDDCRYLIANTHLDFGSQPALLYSAAQGGPRGRLHAWFRNGGSSLDPNRQLDRWDGTPRQILALRPPSMPLGQPSKLAPLNLPIRGDLSPETTLPFRPSAFLKHNLLTLP